MLEHEAFSPSFQIYLSVEQTDFDLQPTKY